jgi:hypothetical protein
MTAYFVFKQIDQDLAEREFVFALEDEGKAALARAIIADPKDPRRSVSGTVSTQPVWYNPEWSFHFDPNTINFFELSIEVCDANVSWIEKNITETNATGLPNEFWCPWSSKLDREVFPKSDAAAEIRS